MRKIIAKKVVKSYNEDTLWDFADIVAEDIETFVEETYELIPDSICYLKEGEIVITIEIISEGDEPDGSLRYIPT